MLPAPGSKPRDKMPLPREEHALGYVYLPMHLCGIHEGEQWFAIAVLRPSSPTDSEPGQRPEARTRFRESPLPPFLEDELVTQKNSSCTNGRHGDMCVANNTAAEATTSK